MAERPSHLQLPLFVTFAAEWDRLIRTIAGSTERPVCTYAAATTAVLTCWTVSRAAPRTCALRLGWRNLALQTGKDKEENMFPAQ